MAVNFKSPDDQSQGLHMTRAIFLLLLIYSTPSLALEVTTPSGTLVGAGSDRSDAIAVFKNIPYAIPPVGARRWTYAKPSPAWKGKRNATQFSASCQQHPYPQGSFFSRPSEPASEDCLYLNVWSSMPDAKKKKLPVMVWIHGGALTRGSGVGSTYDGTELAKKGVVLVTINYRLGVFGYMAHPELSAESKHNASGNYGTSDQIQALRWVQQNIGAFGGDPKNVTIFGESAGSWSVHHLVSSPEAKGLFHRAIGQSGGNFRPLPHLRGNNNSAETRGVKLQEILGASSISDMRKLDTHKIMEADDGRSYRAIVDGRILPDQLYRLFERGEFNQVPFMLGYNAEEGTTLGALRYMPENAEGFQMLLQQRYEEQASALSNFYPKDQLRDSVLRLSADSGFGWNMHHWANKANKHGVSAYMYYFVHRPLGEKLGAFHAAEIVYAFNNASYSNLDSEADRNLANIMSDYWINFAIYGNPNGNSFSSWKNYSGSTKDYMEFGAEGAKPGNGLMQGSYEAFEAHYARER